MLNDREAQGADSPTVRSNWWEGYIIRYTLGSLVGAVICWQIIDDLNGRLAIKSFLHAKEDVVKYVILLLMGLCYCYVASSPMLTFHVSRFREIKSVHKNISWNVFFIFLFGWLFFICALLALSGYWKGDFSWVQLKFIMLGMIPPFFVFIVQYVFLPKSDSDVIGLFNFYDDLSFLRYYTFTDIMTSYRHLREHGNAYSVLLLEILLGWCLVWAIKVEVYLAIAVLVAWVSPSAFVWVIGTNIEKRYLKVHLQSAKKKHQHLLSEKKVRRLRRARGRRLN